jgi:1-deoxy-D-xylulose-5-phosphate synthase
VSLLASLTGPADLRRLPASVLPELAAEIRDRLVSAVARTGGHLGPNLGVVELTIALHRVFDSPSDPIVWDTGHQSYVHKMLTGRVDAFDSLRQPGGLSGYPSRAESEHDLVENSHASTALSYADGLSKALRLRGETGRSVVAVVGDGALTGGMCWEALNNIAAAKNRVVMVVNDNGRSYAPTIGGLAEHLASLRMSQGYERALDLIKTLCERTPLLGEQLYEALHGMKRGMKDVLQPQVLFEDLGLKYVGPIDGHDIGAVEFALSRARDFAGPVIVHVVTRKGNGFGPAEEDVDDCLHAVGTFDGVAPVIDVHARPDWTSVFADEICAIGERDRSVVALTAAMLAPVGLKRFAAAHPDRVFDVGIAEQHAVTSAAGMALGGLHPFVCIYATFLNRAFDQVLMDVALHGLPVTFVLDRAGVTGSDGPSHNGMWDLSWGQLVPGLRIAAPRDAGTLRQALREAAAVTDGPTLVRYNGKQVVSADLPVVRRVGTVDVLHEGSRPEVLLVGVGPLAATAVEVARQCAAEGVGVTVVDPRWVTPVSPDLLELAAGHALVVTAEDGGVVGGVGARLARALAEAGIEVPVRSHGLRQEFLEQGTRAGILADHGLDAVSLTRAVLAAAAPARALLDPSPAA